MIATLNQPIDGKLGDLIEGKLSQDPRTGYNRLYFLVAYAKWSGVGRLKPFFSKFREAGGDIRGVVGVDQKNTSVQALEGLVDNCNELFVFHHEGFSRTYHPKLYLFEAPTRNAWASIGSSNLTAGGLYENYEINAAYAMDLAMSQDNTRLDQLLSIFNTYADPSDGRCKKVTREFIQEMYDAGYIVDEEQARQTLVREKRAQLGSRRKLFATGPPPKSRVRMLPRRSASRTTTAPVPGTNGGFWKKLSRNDVSLTSSPGQIVVPIGFKDSFPPMDEPMVMDSGAEQSETSLNVVLERANGERLRIDNARAIYYVPAPHHARRNSELRFTFLDRAVLEMLEEDDVLLFERVSEPSVHFVIRHIRVGSPEYANFEGRRRYRSL